MFATIGTATYDLSSVRISSKEYGNYLTTTYATNNTFAVHGPLSAAQGLSAVHASGTHVNIASLPTADTGLTTGDLYTSACGAKKILMVK